MIASPVIAPAGQVVQVVAVVVGRHGHAAVTGRRLTRSTRRAASWLRLEGDALSKLNVGQRLKLLEEKIIKYTRDLMHFDHFAIRLLDRKEQQALSW